MKLVETFKKLNAIYDNPYNITEAFTDRNTLIANIKSTGRNYNFDRWSDTQLYRMWQRIQQEEHNKKIARKILDNNEKAKNIKYCPDCKTQLSDNGTCPRCNIDYGWEETLDEGVFDSLPNTNNWVSMTTGSTIKAPKSNSTNNTTSNKLHYVISATVNGNIKDSLFYWDYKYILGDMNDLAKHQDIFKTIADAEIFAKNIFNEPAFAMKPAVYIMSVDIVNQDFHLIKSVENPYQQQSSTNNIVTLVYDGNRLRAQADDGKNGKGWVAFPNNLRTKAGQQYEVDGLFWNGKNYRVIGNITPINSVRYVVANDNILDKYAIQFVHHIDSNKGRTYGLSELEELEDDCFSDTLIDAKTRVRDVMKHWPYSDLYIIEVDENNNLGTIVASYT